MSVLLDYGNWGVLQAKGNATANPKFGRSEANHSAGMRQQNTAMLWRNCHALRRRRSTKVVVVGGAYSNKFSREYPRTSFKTIFGALDYEKKKLLKINVKNSFYCTELPHTL
jgi:hypothetical protein